VTVRPRQQRVSFNPPGMNTNKRGTRLNRRPVGQAAMPDQKAVPLARNSS